MKRVTFWLSLLLALGAGIANAADTQGRLFLVKVADPIGPAVAEFMIDAMQKASEAEAAAIVFELDTPGGLVESMRKIVQAIYACTVPVVVYVSPSGARAASAGVMITMAADVAAMAPGTNIGAAHPVGAGGNEIGETMAEKVTNDMVAFTKGIAKRRGRNQVWAEKAVRESVSATADEALENKIIDIVAKDIDDLVRQIDKRKIEGKGQLQLEKAQFTRIEETLRTRILKLISDPNIVYILMMIAMAGLYFELSNPGAVLPGVIGAIALILALFAFQTLPVNTAGILLIVLAVIFFILEIKVTSYGLLSLAGVASLILGSMMLFKDAGPGYQLAWKVILPSVFAITAFFMIVATLAVRAHANRVHTGSEGLIGEVGVVKSVEELHGKVLVHGELWRAEFTGPVRAGEKVRVVQVQDLVVTVKPITDKPSWDGQAVMRR